MYASAIKLSSRYTKGFSDFWNVDAKVKPYLPTQYVDKQFWISDEWYAENGNKAIELWNAWMLKKA